MLKKLFWIFCPLILLVACNNNISPKKKNEKTVNQIVIKSPIPELDIKFEDFELDNSKDQVIKTKKGTEIKIPAASIVDANGKEIKGSIQLKFREFHDAVDIFLSGIPMDYNAQGQKRNMQTAGMFEIRAEQSGKPLSVAKGKKIDVKSPSFESGTDYSVFYLDEKGKGWEFLDYNYNVEVNTEKEKLKKSIEKKAPAMPFPLDSKYFSFDYMGILDAMMNNDYRKIRDNRDNPSLVSKAKKYGLSWLNSYCNQDVTFKGVEYPAALMVWKRISGDRFPSWLKDDQKESVSLTLKKDNIYNIVIESSDGKKVCKATIEAIMPLVSLFKFEPDYWEKNYKEAMSKVEEELKRLKNEADVFRSFEISGFGIYNYDKLMKEENPIDIIANFSAEESVKKSNAAYDMNMVFFIPDDNKTLIKYPKNDWDKVILIPGNKARFISVLPGSALGVYSAEKYSELDFEGLRKKEKPKLDFVLEKTIEKVGSADDIRKALNF